MQHEQIQKEVAALIKRHGECGFVVLVYDPQEQMAAVECSLPSWAVGSITMGTPRDGRMNMVVTLGVDGKRLAQSEATMQTASALATMAEDVNEALRTALDRIGFEIDKQMQQSRRPRPEDKTL